MINKKCDIGDAEIEFETGKLAIQSPGSVVVKSGETMVLVTAVSNQDVREGIDTSTDSTMRHANTLPKTS